MKNTFFSVLCMTLLCAALMLGVMALYRLIGSKKVHSNAESVKVHRMLERFETRDFGINLY